MISQQLHNIKRGNLDVLILQILKKVENWKKKKNKQIWPRTQKEECGPLWKRFSIFDQSLKLFLRRNCINVIQMSPLALPRTRTLIRKKVRQNKAVQSKWEGFNQDSILLISRLKVCHVYIQYGFIDKKRGDFFSNRTLLIRFLRLKKRLHQKVYFRQKFAFRKQPAEVFLSKKIRQLKAG